MKGCCNKIKGSCHDNNQQQPFISLQQPFMHIAIATTFMPCQQAVSFHAMISYQSFVQ